MVTLNYRLGPLGFAVGANVAAAGEEGNGGMNGFNDIITALKWLQARRNGPFASRAVNEGARPPTAVLN